MTGMMVIQLAKESGLNVFAIAKLRNTSLLLDIGAGKVADRHTPEEVIAEAKNLGILLGIDCVGQETATWALRALQPGGKLAYLVKKPVQDAIETSMVNAIDLLIKRFREDQAHGRTLVDYISRCLFTRRVRPVRREIVQSGLDAIEIGLQRLMNQDVSGKKLIVLFDT